MKATARTLTARPTRWFAALGVVASLVAGRVGSAEATAPLEWAEYQVKLGAISAGTGVIEMRGHAMVDGHDTYHTVLRITGGLGPARVNDRFESWLDVKSWTEGRTVVSRRFTQNQQELRYRRTRTYEFFPERRQYRRVDTGEISALPTDQPLDDVSMLYYARSLPLKVGDTYSIPRYFKADANPVVLRVLRQETITVPAGTFRTVVVQPTIKTSGLFGKGGQAELYFTDDADHTLVQLRSKVSVIGSLTLQLKRRTEARK
jgi:hypothetical protein